MSSTNENCKAALHRYDKGSDQWIKVTLLSALLIYCSSVLSYGWRYCQKNVSDTWNGVGSFLMNKRIVQMHEIVDDDYRFRVREHPVQVVNRVIFTKASQLRVDL